MTKMGRYRYWGDQKPDTSRPLLTFSRPAEAVTAKKQQAGEPETLSTFGTLRIYGPIDSWGGYWGVSAKEVAQALDLLGDVERIVVRVNSPGGESSEGRAIMNLLRAHPAECISVVDGGAYSAASYIAVGCNERVMSPGTTLMIHDTSTIIYGNADALRKQADTLDTISNSGAELYAEVAGGTVEEWRDRQKAESWYTAASAVESGLMDRVGIVPDAGPAETAGDTGPEPVDSDAVDDRARADYDLSLFDQGRIPAPLKPPTVSAGGTTQPEGAAVVDLNDTQITALREQVGFPADADADTIVAAVTEALGERAEGTSGTTATATSPAIPEGMALVDAAVLNQLKSDASAGAGAAKTLASQERDRAIGQALKDGKIAATSREKLVEAWDKDPASTQAILDSLTPGLVPTSEAGHESEPSELGAGIEIDESELDAFAASLGMNKEALRG